MSAKQAKVKEQLLEAWQIHNEKNVLLLQNIAEGALLLSLNKRSHTVGQQLAHVHNNRIKWLEFVAKGLYNGTDLLAKRRCQLLNC